MKVAHIIIGLTMGGAEKVVVDLCTKSKENPGQQFYVVSLTNDMDRKPDLDKIGIPVISLGVKKNIKSIVRACRELRTYLRSKKIDVIHVHMTHAYLITILASLPDVKPIVFTGHNTNLGSKWRELFLWVTRRFRNFDIIFEEDQQRYFHKKRPKTVVLPNGIPVSDIKTIQKGCTKNDIFTFINIGNLEYQKNQRALIKTAAELRKTNKKFQILIIGEGSKYQELNKSILDHQLEDVVVLLGKRKDVPKLLAESHCFVLPSHWEGMPITILEAGITNIPVVSTPVGNVPQLLGEDRGYVVELDQFSQKMKYVIEHYPEALEKAEKLSKFIENHFSLEYTYKRHLELYHQAANH